MGVPSPAVLALLGCGDARFHAGVNFAFTEFSKVRPKKIATWHTKTVLSEDVL
jgi:hypothetical protein